MCNPPKRRYSRVFLVREIVGTFLTGVRCRKKPQKRRKKETSAPWRQKKRKKKKICNENKEEKRTLRRRRRRRLRRSTPTPTILGCDRERTRTCLKKRGRFCGVSSSRGVFFTRVYVYEFYGRKKTVSFLTSRKRFLLFWYL